ncbi:MAG: uroporphyrinogen decarboxylase family protein [Candidatus Ranarchaeia archaeon]|jgi:uroporphyrinogen decarboxylase
MSPISFSSEEKHQLDQYLKQIDDNIAKEEQTPIERWMQAENHREPNRVPSRLGSMCYNSRAIDVKVKDVLLNPEKAVLANVATVAKFAPDNVHPYADPHILGTEETGTKIRYPEDGTPVFTEYPIKNPEDLRTLEIPDPYTDGKLPMVLEILQTTYDLLGDKVILSQNTNGPFGMAGDLIGPQQLLFYIMRDPDFVEELLDFCTELAIVITKAVQKTGAVPHPFDAMVSPHYIGVDNYLKIVLPRQEQLMKALTPPGAFLGIDGHVASIIKQYAGAGARQITIESFKDYDSLTEIKKQSYKKTMIHVGVLRPNDLLYWDEKRMRKEIGDIISICAPGGGFIPGVGVVPTQAPLNIVKAAMDLVKELGTPPYNK